MPKYLVLYKSTTTSEELMANSTPEQMEAGMQAWMEWSQRTGDALLDLGSPLGNGKKVTTDGATDGGAHIGGYSVLQADSIDEATALVKDHPHFMTPGDSAILVLEYMPIPGMEG